jgi:cell division inhibitor SulA
MTRKIAIEKLLGSTPQLWRGRQASRSQRALPTGHAKLDACLPGNGWPLGAVTELISRKPGLGELRLLFPALVDTGKQGQWVILVDPPWIPYPAALKGHGLLLERLLVVRGGKDSLWACEQALRSGRGGAVLAWPEQVSFARLRRLQIATENSAKLAFLFRPDSALRESSPAALRLWLEPGDHYGTRINILKCRGSRTPEPVWIPQPFSPIAAGDSNNVVDSNRLPAQDRAPLAENSINTALAGSPPSTTCPGPPYPRSK